MTPVFAHDVMFKWKKLQEEVLTSDIDWHAFLSLLKLLLYFSGEGPRSRC
jgi:hypothetical protein